ncbi:MAG: CHAT domain-containing protein, partial [Leptolyngbyaceae cyanobacterium MO_188.B28]|nr:CHAT domain-containing protein [Leptolyngbyaceae cyanobacterium MO_188.B28]
ALSFYQQAAAISTSPQTHLQIQLAQLSLLVEMGEQTAAQSLSPRIHAQLDASPVNRTTVYNRINFARSLLSLKQLGDNGPKSNNQAPHWRSIAELLATAVQQAKDLRDQRAEAYALGNLAAVYEHTQQWSIAQDLTQKALQQAQAINAADIAYRWQWQLGRLLKTQGDAPKAIAAYSQAVATVKSLRGDLVAINPEVQFSFREDVEPIYRQLVSLLLEPDQRNDVSQDHLAQARDVIESLQVAELDNFFREACLNAESVQIDQIDQQSAVVYPIMLEDRLEIILRLPQQPLKHYTTALPEDQLQQSIEQLRQKLVIRSRRSFLPLSQQLYDWLIRPLANDLQTSGVDTLVFVLDGPLQNIPMAALHNGERFLLEDYRIALTPGLQLLDPKPLPKEDLKSLVAGLSQGRQGFAPLSHVPLELEEIESELPNSTVLLDQTFTTQSLQEKIESSPFPIVHIATHGQFSSNAAQTFILAWDNPINVIELDHILQSGFPRRESAIELLVLSACETLAGDRRAALGLAGVAVRAGARSTLATLWSVNDEATTELMGQFYAQLTNPDTTRAEALRQAQLSLLNNPQYRHPLYWAPYVLLGNWL